MTIKTPYKSEVIEEIKVDTSSIDGKIDVVDGLIDSLIARITEARAGYLDNINNSNLATLPAISSARIGYLDNINQSGLLQVTGTRAGYLDNLSGGAVALNSTVAKEATLTHTTYGLDKIKTETASLVGKVDVIDGIVDSIVAKTNLIGASVAPADEYDTEMARITGNVALEATLTAIKGGSWSNETLKAIYDSIGGLNDITAASVWAVGTRALTDKANFTLSTSGIDAIRTSVCLTGDTANSIGKILYDYYNTRLSSTRCGYLDLLVNGTYGLAALDTDLGTIITNVGTVDTVVDAIKAKTDLLFSGIATEAKQNTIIGYIDTEVGAIKAKTDLIGASVALSGEYTSALSTIDAYFDVTTADASTDATIRDVVGRKTDTANTTVGTTSSLMRYIKGILGVVTSGTYGLSVIEGLVDDLEGRLTATRAGYLDYLANGTYGLSALNTDLDSLIASLANATYGLSAIKTAINAIPTTAMRGTDNAALASVWTSTRGGYIDLLANATYGLNAIKTAVNAIPTTAMRGTDNAALASVWTSTRGGYIDYLANGTYGLAAIKTQTGEIYSFLSGYLNQAIKTSSSPSFVKLTLSQATGTAPLTISSTTVCTNLNADMLDGYHSSSFLNDSGFTYFIHEPMLLNDGVTYEPDRNQIIVNNPTERSITSTTLVKLKEVTLPTILKVNYIIATFEMKASSGLVYGRVYLDGTGTGTTHSNNTTEYIKFTNNVNTSAKTYLQVYGRSSSVSTCYIRNQRVEGVLIVLPYTITGGY